MQDRIDAESSSAPLDCPVTISKKAVILVSAVVTSSELRELTGTNGSVKRYQTDHNASITNEVIPDVTILDARANISCIAY